MLTDTHAHLDFPEFQADLPGVLSRAAAAGVTRINTIGTGIDSSRCAVALAEQWPQIFAVVGVHPNAVHNSPADFLALLRNLARNPRVVAIGETGLDYHRLRGRNVEDSSAANPGPGDPDAAKAAQAGAFRAQLDLAAELHLPVVIHERDAWDDTLAILHDYTGRLRAVFHCFSKGPGQARELLALGHIVSFTGIVTFKNAAEARASATSLPAGAFMIETDCPYLAPVPNRGKRCEPAFARDTAEAIAKMRAVTLDELGAQTEATARAFFRYPR